ncbi:hypothetical protein CA54_38230 [Symmachiella macrocystis]|uniref:HD-GYP domain-containing protein n=1 Tax=Symmachiella macrocystis TaxID=2527985 RepID=A0A5C6BRS5_9PLAN|nr:HD domain-containing phosphohydrolase [Symmachiella macrocystis]TWU14953.1 hypothetical protein CA54_38230 [Symmachiella macrocystis]
MNTPHKPTERTKEQLILEISIIVVTMGLTCLLYQMQAYKMVILNLFFLPVVLSGFFLGRYLAGITALFCFMSASIVIALNLSTIEIYASASITALAITAWGAVLGLTSLLIGTLSDERRTQMGELHDAYVGVVEVLSRYLQSAHPRLKDRSVRIAELSQKVAAEMRLTARETDDIRVAALLYDVGNIEITTSVIRKAVGALEHDNDDNFKQTIQGMDLVMSLGSILNGAVPLLLNQDQQIEAAREALGTGTTGPVPLGAKIIRAVRAYDNLLLHKRGNADPSPVDPFTELQQDSSLDRGVLEALKSVTAEHSPAGASPWVEATV